MKNTVKKISWFFVLVSLLILISVPICAAETADDATVSSVETTQESDNTDNITESSVKVKAYAAAFAIGLVAAAGAVSMGISIKKSVESISRQPEAGGEIRTSMMLGLVFIETAIIYALIVAILIIFVL